MSVISTKLRNATLPNAWYDPQTLIQAADRIDELEAKVSELQEKLIELSTAKQEVKSTTTRKKST